MYVCNAILNIGLPSTYSLMALESKGGYVCKHFVLTFFAKFSQPFLMKKRNKTMDQLKNRFIIKYILGSNLQGFESVQLFMTESSPNNCQVCSIKH